MIWHCGLLDEQPEKSRTLNWIKRPIWGNLPPDVERELRIFLAMPGFSVRYISHVFRIGPKIVTRNLGGYEDWKAEVDQNWASATRDDCVRLARMRPHLGDVPVICQFQAIDDVKSGMSQSEVAREYGMSTHPIQRWINHGVLSRQPLPLGFSLLQS